MPSLRTLVAQTILLALLAPACGHSTVSPETVPLTTSDPPPATEVELRFEVTKSVEPIGVNLLWTGLNDSRCPTGVQCIWAGEATVTLTVEVDGASRTEVIKLSPNRDAQRSFAASGHTFTLQSVEPYPRSGAEVEPSQRRARLTVERR